jgi:MYXO-CTERM domain-containing protein
MRSVKMMAVMMVVAMVTATAGADVVALKRDAGIVSGGNLDSVFADAISGATASVVTGTAEDARLWNAGDDRWQNHGAATTTSTDAALYKFDLSSIPFGSTIQLAEIRIVQNNGNTGTRSLGYVATWDWIEGTELTWYPGAAGGSSYAHPAGFNTAANRTADNTTGQPRQSWGDGNDFFNPTATTSGTICPVDGTSPGDGAGSRTHKTLTGGNLSPLVFDVTDVVTAWVNGSLPNYGFYTNDTGGGSSYVYRLSEYGSTSQPVLFIDFTPPVAEPGFAGLLLVGTGAALRRRRRA